MGQWEDEPFSMVEGVGYDGLLAGRFPFLYLMWDRCLCPRTLGLSHMLDEDGNIVYEGLYYGHGKFFSGITGVKADRPVSVQVNRRDVRVTVPAHEQGAVSLMDLNGKVLRTIAVAEGDSEVILPNLPQGVYVIQYRSAGHHQSFKVGI